ncbi:MAG: thiamine phosphate synthase [Oscillospiraceae bacterium]
MKKQLDYSVYLVTDSQLKSTETIEQAVEAAIVGGVTLVQLREKNIESLGFYNEAIAVKEICHRYNVPLIINDRLDIALAVDADGVHLGQSDIPAAVAREIIGQDKILGVSASNLEQAEKAQWDGADYLGVGAMFATGTKTDAKLVSKEQLREIVEMADIPVVIIGGVNENTIPQFRDVKIDGVSVVSAIIAKQDITGAARRVKEIFMQGR